MEILKGPQFSENYGTPADAPAYGPLPTVYRNVRFNYVYFTTDPENIARLLPDPFEPPKEGLCAAFCIEVPFSSSYGPFNEMGTAVQARFKGRDVFYLPALFLDNDSAIAAGREIYGSPKKYADINIGNEAGVFTAKCRKCGTDIITITTRIIRESKEGELPEIFPIYNLKMIPSIDGGRPAVKQLTSTGVDRPVTHYSYLCDGTVRFDPSCVSGIYALKPERIIGASCSAMDYEQGYGSVVYDYLKA